MSAGSPQSGPLPDGPPPDHALDETLVRSIVEAGLRRYFDSRRAQVGPFVDAHFGWRGALGINAKGLGGDMLRAPVNTLLVAPALARDAAAYGLARAGKTRTAETLRGTSFFLKTDVAREVDWLLFSRFLDLPFEEDPRGTTAPRSHPGDAMAAAILSDPHLIARLEPALLAAARAYRDPARRDWLHEAMRDYAEARAATAELATLSLTMMTGALIAKDFTPGLISLGPAITKIAAHHAATHAAGAGAGASAAWLGSQAVHPSTALVVGMTGAMMVGAAAVTAVAGVVTDPVQRHLGLHQRRLHVFLDTLEERLLDRSSRRYKVVDAYVGRIIDLADFLYGVWRLG